MDFDSAAVQGGMTSPFFQTVAPNTGKAVADLIVTRLVKASEVTVIERAALDKLLAEQNFSNSDRTDALTAARIWSGARRGRDDPGHDHEVGL